MACEARLDRAIKSGDSEKVAVARVELTSLLIKKDQVLAVSARLKNVSRGDEYGH